MEVLFLIIIFVLGLCCGSFVNMLIYRVAMDYELINSPSPRLRKGEKRSFCDHCGRQLKWYENIPVVSWMIQRGKTRCCGKKLSVLYPIVELVTGILFVIFLLNFNFVETLPTTSLQLVFGLLILVFLVFSAVFDLKYMILPDFSIVILVSGALVLWCARYFGNLNYIWSAVLSFGFLGFLYLITQKRGMGFGDVKLAIFMGLFLGYPKIIVAFYVSFVVGAIISLILMIFKKANRKSQIPFGPFLILGTIVAWWWGEIIIKCLMTNF